MSSNVLRDRRSLCPSLVVTIIGQLWPTIDHLKELKQTITLDKLKAHMYKKFRMTSNDCEKLVTNALVDNLLVANDGTDKNGAQMKIYMIPEDNGVDDGHDWYCYECHKPGAVAECADCWRVFHSYCTKQPLIESDEPFICSVCRELETEKEGMIGERVVSFTELNELLGYAYNQLIKNKDKTKEMNDLITIKDDEPNIRRLLYYRMDLSQIQFKTKNNSFKKLIEFQTDVQNVVHCMSLLYGSNGVIIGLAAQTLTDCIKELDVIKECVDCYRMSNRKQDKNWFSKPCTPPHELVFAKQKGYPYWPAKVIRRYEDECDVRFFGQFHERSIIELNNVKPIDTTLQQLRITKQSPPLTQAMKELKQYQNNLLVNGCDIPVTIRSPIRAASGKRPRRRADGTRPRKRNSIKVEIKREINEQNETSSDSVDPNSTEPSFIANPKLSPKRYQTMTSTPKPNAFVKSPIRTRNRGMKTPFQTKITVSESKRSPAKGRPPLHKLSPVKSHKMSTPKKKISEMVANTSPSSSSTPRKSLNNKRNKKLVNGMTDDHKNDGSDTEDTPKAKRLKSDENAQTSSLARSRPVRQIKPNTRFKSPEMEVKIPRRNLRNDRIKKEPKEEAVPPQKVENECVAEDSNSVNISKINDSKTKIQTKRKSNKTLNAVKSLKINTNTEPILYKQTLNVITSSPPVSPQLLMSAISPITNGPSNSSSPISPIVSPKGRGRPKGVKNKSTLEKMRLDSLKTSQSATSKRIPVLVKELAPISSTGCNCHTKYNKIIKNIENQHKEETKQLKKDLETVKQLNYRLQNENKSLKSESQGREELNALKEQYSTEISDIKKKQWCFNCEKEAIYFCCWNTSYCSTQCQQQHWHNGHKKTCRRAAAKR